MEVLPEPRSCLGGSDECGFVHELRRYGVSMTHASDGVLVIPGDCDELIVWSPRHRCARRVIRPDTELAVITRRHDGRFVTVVGSDAVVLEPESESLPSSRRLIRRNSSPPSAIT
jgi:hypothetical protein